MVVKVFKTNIKGRIFAKNLITQIHRKFEGYKANFDLDDCDNILRIECATGYIQSAIVIDFLEDLGCHAEILPDIYEPIDRSAPSQSPRNHVQAGLESEQT